MNYTIALLLSPKVQNQIAARLCFGLPNAVWTEPDCLHLIVKQLGSLTHPQLDEIKEALESIYFNPFEVQLNGIQYTPLNRSQGNLFLECIENEPLKQFKKEIEMSLKDLKIPPNKQNPYIHLGIGPFQKVGEYLFNNGAFTSSSGELGGCALFSMHSNIKKIFLKEVAHYPSSPFSNGID